MQTDNLNEQLGTLLDNVDRPDELGILEEPITEGEFAELIEGEVIENPPKPSGIPIKWLIPISVVSLVLALAGVLLIAPLLTESATISITPDVQRVTATGDVTVPARMLVSKTITLSEQVKTTGTAHQAATEAHGWVTFYNALQAPQTVPAETLLIGADGIHVTTDTDAYIPGGTLATNGMRTVAAHATVTGQSGNIPAGDMNGPCCREYVFAYSSAFSGGQDARDYRTATTSDIGDAGKDLTTRTITQLTTQTEAQLTADEAITTPQCHSATTSTPKPSIEAARVLVRVTSHCNIYAYSRSALTTQEHTLFTQVLRDQLGAGYEPKGMPTSVSTRTTFSSSMLTISLVLTGEGMYRFQRNELQHISLVVAGKSQAQATALLLQLRGVHTVSIQIDHGQTTVPGDPQHIAVSVYDKE